MAHKIGITLPVRLELCKGELEKQYPTLYNWRVLASGLTHSEAKEIEVKYSKRGYEVCKCYEIVSDPVYCVYAFDY